MTDFTVDEIISVCIARQITDGEGVAQGIATPLVMAGYLLAKRTHAPNLMFASAIGQAMVMEWAPLGLARVEALWLDKAASLLALRAPPLNSCLASARVSSSARRRWIPAAISTTSLWATTTAARACGCPAVAASPT